MVVKWYHREYDEAVEIEILPSKKGPPTMRAGGEFVYSAYDPVREAERRARREGEGPYLLVGLGLGYLAEALSRRGETEVLAAPGERELISRERPGFTAVAVVEAVGAEAARHLARRYIEGRRIVTDPSIIIRPETAAMVSETLGLLSDPEPLTVAVYLDTAGDILRATPVLRAISAEPGLLYLVTREMYLPLVEDLPFLDGIIPYSSSTSPSEDRIKASLPRRPILGINLQWDDESGRVLRSLNPLFRVGYIDGRFRDDRKVERGAEVEERRNRMNRIRSHFFAVGVPPGDEIPSVVVTDEGRDEADGLMNDLGIEGGYIVIQPGAGSEKDVWGGKRTPPEVMGRWISGCDRPVILAGGENERERAALVMAASRDAIAADLTGRTTWKGLAALISRAEYYIGHDSGPTHIAAALGIPTLALFGFTSPILNMPVGRRTLTIQAEITCAFGGCRVPCPELECIRRYDESVISRAFDLLEALFVMEDLAAALAAAARLREKGFRPFFGIEATMNPFVPLLRAAAEKKAEGPGSREDLSIVLFWETLSRRERGEAGFMDRTLG